MCTCALKREDRGTDRQGLICRRNLTTTWASVCSIKQDSAHVMYITHVEIAAKNQSKVHGRKWGLRASELSILLEKDEMLGMFPGLMAEDISSLTLP